MQPQPKKPNYFRQMIIMAVFAGLLLIVANSAFWVNKYVFNTQNFTEVTTTALTSESTTQAIGAEVTDRVFADRPKLKQVLGNTSTRLVSGLLGTEQANKAIETVVSKLQVLVTSSDQKDIAINLEGLKSTMEKVINAVGNPEDPKINPDNIPSQIVLVSADDIPNFYNYGVVFLWLGPLALIGAVALILVPYFGKKLKLYKLLLYQGAIIVGTGLLAFLVGPLFRPPLLAQIPSTNSRVVVENLYNGFISTYNSQSSFLLVLGGVFILAGIGSYFVPKYVSRHSTIR